MALPGRKLKTVALACRDSQLHKLESTFHSIAIERLASVDLHSRYPVKSAGKVPASK